MDIIITLLRHSPALIVAVPLFGAFLTPLVGKINAKLRNIFAILTILCTVSIVFLLAYNIFSNGGLAPSVINNGIQTYVFGAQSIGAPAVRIAFEVDGINIFMAIIGSILALAAVIYSWAYMKGNTGLDKYYTLFLLMTAGMLGMMLTGDLFNFFVFLEITSIASCALIAFYTNKGRAIDAGLKYIIVSTIGALFILFAIALLYGQYNALNMGVIANSIQWTFLDKIAFVLIIAGLAMKAGIVPMHMWLPDAYGRAPASISILLIGATQASLYGLFRMVFTVYGNIHLNTDFTDLAIVESIANTNALGWFLILLALSTMFIGVLMALKQVNLKRLIAFAALAEIGYMLLGIGVLLASKTAIYNEDNALIGIEFGSFSGPALTGSVFHIMNDALDIGLLFLVAGAIYYATKETSLNKMGGLARNMKYTTVFFIIGLLAVSGMPPMNGFASKLLIYESAFLLNPIIGIIAILCSIMLLAIFVKVFQSAFLGPALPRFKNVKEAPKSMLIAMAILAGIIIFFGLFPDYVVENLVNPAVRALIDNTGYIAQIMGGA